MDNLDRMFRHLARIVRARHPQNEYANHLAVRAARAQTQSGGIVASTFDEWLAVEREKRRVTVEPQAFPTDDAFRASRQYPVVARPNSVT